MSGMIQQWESEDFEAMEYVGWACSEEDAQPNWKARYEEAIVAGDYTAARYAKNQMDV